MFDVNSDLFDCEIFCRKCGSDKVELFPDTETMSIRFLCECGMEDIIKLEDLRG